jgi:hypothetical protein
LQKPNFFGVFFCSKLIIVFAAQLEIKNKLAVKKGIILGTLNYFRTVEFLDFFLGSGNLFIFRKAVIWTVLSDPKDQWNRRELAILMRRRPLNLCDRKH